jgi:hypothetical protein
VRAGSVVIDILASNMVEFEWMHALTAAGMHYLFLPVQGSSDSSAGADALEGEGEACVGEGSYCNCVSHPPKCRQGTPYEASSMDCLGIRNCDVAAWFGGLEVRVLF